MLKITEKNKLYYNKFNDNNTFKQSYNINICYVASSPIPIKGQINKLKMFLIYF